MLEKYLLKNSQKTILGIVLLILAGILIISGILWFLLKEIKAPAVVNELTAEQDVHIPGIEINTSDWQTYKNEEYGFKIDYPNKWIVNTGYNTYTKENIFTFANYKLSFGGEAPQDFLAFYIMIYPRNNTEAFAEFKKIESEMKKFSSEIEEYIVLDNLIIKLYTISERTEEKENMTWDIILPYSKAFLEDDDYGYYFYFAYHPDSQGKELEILRISLSTFKFINQEEISFSNWQTYRNEEWGFEFQYPPDYEISASTYHDLVVSNSYSNININIKFLEGGLSKDNIYGIYGKIKEEDLNSTYIDGKLSYYFLEGDAGAGGNSYHIPLGEDNTMQFWFVSDGGTFHYEEQIISSFKFIEPIDTSN